MRFDCTSTSQNKEFNSCGVLPSSRKRSSKAVSISFKELGVLCAATKHIPERTPKRWDLISTLVSGASPLEESCDENKSPNVVLKVSDGARVNFFDKSPASCKDVVSVMCTKYNEMFDCSETVVRDILLSYVGKTALKSIILLPQAKKCCGEPILIRNRPSFPLVYTMQGTFVAALFNGECRKGCCRKFSHSYYHEGDKIHYYDPRDSDYFHISTQTVFSNMLIQ